MVVGDRGIIIRDFKAVLGGEVQTAILSASQPGPVVEFPEQAHGWVTRGDASSEVVADGVTRCPHVFPAPPALPSAAASAGSPVPAITTVTVAPV